VLYRPPSFWDLYRWRIVGATVLVGLQSLLIVGLVAQRRRRGRAERALTDNEKKLKLITDSLPVLIAYVDRDQRYQFCNKAFQSWFSIDPEAARGRTMREVLGQRLYAVLRPFAERTLAGDFESFATEAVMENGRKLAVEAVHVPDFDEMGAVRGFYSLKMDVTARNQAQHEAGRLQDELAHAGRVSLMGTLATSLAHELNQPLAAIMSNAQAAQRFLQAPTPHLQEISEILDDIVLDDQRAGEIILRMRALAKKRSIELISLDVAELLREIKRLTTKNAVMRDIALSFDVEENLPHVRGDRVQLQQVLLNLLLNAFEATEDSRRKYRQVMVRASQKDSQIVIEVRDQGVGITDDLFVRLFEPFQSTKKHGLGMGLAISKSIVDRHGGRLWAEKNPKGGATFYLVLPIDYERDEATIEVTNHAESVADGLRG
jgi:PAS domain S-box-containing protein